MKSVDLPNWIGHRLDADHAARIEASIVEAESKTSGEIIPMVVRRSSTIGHVPLVLLLTLLLVVSLLHLFFFAEEHLEWNIWVGLAELMAVLVLVRLLAPLETIQRWLTPVGDQEVQVLARAQLEFYQSSVRQTEGATGVLLFVSLMERQAVVLADQAIDARLDEKDCRGVVGRIVEGIKQEDLTRGLCDGVQECGELLSRHFPLREGDRNELLNHLIIKE